MCGLPCSGKTTLAKQIEREAPALRLTTDEWLLRLLDSDPSVHPDGAIRDRLEALLLDKALRVLALGVDVVLDFGVWSRSEREDFRARAAAVGARSELHYLDVPLDELLSRLPARNAHLPAGTYIIEPEQMRLWWTWFESPTEDELVAREPDGESTDARGRIAP
jgi:predicted kinase